MDFFVFSEFVFFSSYIFIRAVCFFQGYYKVLENQEIFQIVLHETY